MPPAGVQNVHHPLDPHVENIFGLTVKIFRAVYESKMAYAVDSLDGFGNLQSLPDVPFHKFDPVPHLHQTTACSAGLIIKNPDKMTIGHKTLDQSRADETRSPGNKIKSFSFYDFHAVIPLFHATSLIRETFASVRAEFG